MSTSGPGRQAAILLVGHGTRQAAGQRQFAEFAAAVAAKAQGLVEPCCLELVEPDVSQGLARLIERGARQIVVAPVMLGMAGHVRHDIPTQVAAALAQRADVETWLADALECHPAVLDVSRQRFGAALAVDGSRYALDETLLLIVARGSSHAEANAELARFARLRWEQTPVGWVEICFVAAARPSLEQGLEIAARLPFERVVVQPHLLFAGDVLDEIARHVDLARQQHVDRRWLLTAPLGPAVELADALLERVGSARRLN